MSAPLDILAFAPHPDDAELGCGGSLILAAEGGQRVAVADMSLGEASSRGTLESRQKERMQAAELMGLTARYSLGLPDTKIGADFVTQRLPIIELIRETRPRLVLVPYWEDRHPDHTAAGQLLKNALFFAGVGKVGSGIPHRPEQVYFYSLHSPFLPSFVIDVSTTWERKMQAVAIYQSQFQHHNGDTETALSNPNFLRTLEARAIWFGAMIGVGFGEAFYARGPVAMDEFPGLKGDPLKPGKLPPYRIY